MIPKPKRGAYRRAREREKLRARREMVALVRPAVFAAAGGVCACCCRRRAESMHEKRARSVGGVVSTENSIAVCGSGTTKCHGFMQRHEIVEAAPGVFTATTRAAQRWLDE